MIQTFAKPLLRALAGERVQPSPVWLMRQAGRYLPEYRALRAKAGTFLDLCFTPELASEATVQPIRRFALDGAILFSDILVVPWALGQPLRFEEGQGPILDPLVPEMFNRLQPEGIVERLAPVMETVGRVKEALPPAVALIGFAGAPWTVAAYMIEGGGSKEFLEAKRWALGAPERFQKLVNLLVDTTVAYLSAQVKAGAEILQIFDSWAGLLSEPEFERWSFSPLRCMVARLKALHPEVPVIVFPRGAGLGYARFADASGASGLGLDTTVPLGFAAKLQRKVTIQGNLDPAMLVVGGPALEEGVQHILEALGHGPFIFNLGHGVLPQTPPEHVQRLVDFIRRKTE
ncbi:MAG TPA: uroporphyrinogen decarboxylase [Alphaproteobacteria bacterium]|nr:uroporphyrinogen decarboxylase [Alphaproteobacteria bacterium]